jgi:Icc-related predicted phosphoesterase
MTEPDRTLRIAALGDLHVKEDQIAPFRELFGEISRAADVLVLTGDLTDLGRPREAEILAEDLRACSIPVVGVLGNHDYECGHEDDIKAIIKGAGVHLLDGSSHEIDGVGFVGVKGFAGGFGRRMLGSFGEAAIKTFVAETMSEAMRLENAMRSVRARRAVVVLHYAPVIETVEGEPLEIFPFLGSSRLAETIDRFKVSAVVHGHAHRGRYEGRTPAGAPVYNVAYHIEKPSGRPYALIEV